MWAQGTSGAGSLPAPLAGKALWRCPPVPAGRGYCPGNPKAVCPPCLRGPFPAAPLPLALPVSQEGAGCFRCRLWVAGHRGPFFLCFSLFSKFSVTDTKCFIYHLNKMFIRNIISYYFLQYIVRNVFSVCRCTRASCKQLKGRQRGVT